ASFALPAGLQLSGIGRIVSGSPLVITCGCDLDGDGVNDRPPGSPQVVGRGDLQSQLDTINAFRRSRGRGNLTRDQIKVPPPIKNIDVRLTKQVNLGSARRVELFAEAFNITNFVNT